MDLPYIIRMGESVIKRNSKIFDKVKGMAGIKAHQKAMRRSSKNPFRDSFKVTQSISDSQTTKLAERQDLE
jgi:hypothetical protein